MENSSSSSPEPAAAPRTVEYVGFWKRFVAFLIDTFVLMAVLTPLMFAIGGWQGFDVSSAAGGIGNWLVNIAIVVATILFWRYRGATPGKMAISAKIVDVQTGQAPSTARLVVRYFAYIVSMLPFFLGFIWIAIDRRKQGFHDKIAGTAVIYEE